MELPDNPSWAALNQEFKMREYQPSYDEAVTLLKRIQPFRLLADGLHMVPVDKLSTIFTMVNHHEEAVALRGVDQFYTFHSVNYAHSTLRPTMREVFATMPRRLYDNPKICGVALRQIYGATQFGNDTWHVCLATAFVRA